MKKSGTTVLSTYIIASLFSTCLARFCFSFKSHMAENYLDFCINRYLVWVIFSNVYNFERFTNYAFFLQKLGLFFQNLRQISSAKLLKRIDKKILSKNNLNVQEFKKRVNYIVFQTFWLKCNPKTGISLVYIS